MVYQPNGLQIWGDICSLGPGGRDFFLPPQCSCQFVQESMGVWEPWGDSVDCFVDLPKRLGKSESFWRDSSPTFAITFPFSKPLNRRSAKQSADPSSAPRLLHKLAGPLGGKNSLQRSGLEAPFAAVPSLPTPYKDRLTFT